MANLKKLQASLAKKQADLDMMDDQIMGMPEMAMDAPADDMGTSPEFDLLTEKREELEEEIRKMREGVELISQWEKFKGGPWSEEIKGLLGEIDVEIADIAGDEVAPPDAGMGDMMGGAPPMDMGAPDTGAPPMDAAAPAAPDMAAPAAEPVPAAPAAEEAAPVEPAPIEPPMASKGAGKSQVSEKISYQSPVKKGTSARSDIKEGSTMATPSPAKASAQEKLAEVKTKRESIKREAQQRVAAAWTIAKTMLPSAPAEIQKAAAANLLQNPTKILNAMLRQTAKNAHYSKLAETFKQVHKVEMNDLLEDPSILNAEKKAVESEIKGDAKSAKVADDRKDAGPQTATYSDGRGAGGGKHSEPKEMDAGSSSSQTEAEHRPDNTINKSEGDGKVAKVAKCEKCEGECKCASESKHAGHKPDCDCNFCEKKAAEKCADCTADKKCAKCSAKKATSKKADDMPPMDAPPAEAPMGGAPAEEAPMDAAPEAPADLPPTEEGLGEDNPAEILSDEKKMVVQEKIEEAQEAIQALEQEILQEGDEELDLAQVTEGQPEETAEGQPGEELDLSQVFNEDEMEEKVSALANEGDEHTAGNGEEYFGPSSAESMEASLDEPQMASMEDFFSLKGSDSDPLASLIAGEVRTAADVAGMSVVPSSTGEAAKHFESDSATGESRDNENDHDGDLFAEAIEDQTPEDGGFKRVKQDETNELQAPKSATKAKPAAAKAQVIKKLKNVTASEAKPIDIASALLGSDEF